MQRVGQSVFAILLLLLGVALAKVVELGLQTRRAIQIGRALGANLLQLRLQIGDARRSLPADSSSSAGGNS